VTDMGLMTDVESLTVIVPPIIILCSLLYLNEKQKFRM
jgi:hypothetical protein